MECVNHGALTFSSIFTWTNTMALDETSPVSVVVVDANAFISGTRIDKLGAQRVVTTKEVVSEVRDAAARRMMDTLLPNGVQTREPSREALEQGERGVDKSCSVSPLRYRVRFPVGESPAVQ